MESFETLVGSKTYPGPRFPRETRVEFRDLDFGRVGLVDTDVGSPRAQVVFVHGLSEHAGRPISFARRLAERGYRTVVAEFAGHGAPGVRSLNTRWVYEAYAMSGSAGETLELLRSASSGERRILRRAVEAQYETLRTTDAHQHLDQISAALQWARNLDPELPIFLIGHSLGGMLSVEAAWRQSVGSGPALRGVVLLSPALNPTPPEGKVVEKVLFETLWKLRNGPFSPARRAFKSVLSLNLPLDTTAGNRWVSDLPEEVALYASDPLVPHRFPTRYLGTIETLMAATDRRGPRFPVPGLVLVPGTDGITSASAGIEFARSVQRVMGQDRMQLRRMRGVCAHDLLRSSARGKVTATICDWLDRSLAGIYGPEFGRVA